MEVDQINRSLFPICNFHVYSTFCIVGSGRKISKKREIRRRLSNLLSKAGKSDRIPEKARSKAGENGKKSRPWRVRGGMLCHTLFLYARRRRAGSMDVRRKQVLWPGPYFFRETAAAETRATAARAVAMPTISLAPVSGLVGVSTESVTVVPETFFSALSEIT